MYKIFRRIMSFVMLMVLCAPLLTALEISLELPDLASAPNKGGKSLPTVGLHDVFRLQVIVSGGDDQRGDVVIAGLDDFSVLGKSQSTSILVENGHYVSEATY